MIGIMIGLPSALNKIVTRQLVLALIFGCLAFASTEASAQAVLAMANGDPVTAFDVDQRIRLIKLTEHRTATEKEVLEILINDRLKVKEARKYGLELSSSDLDEQYADMARRLHMTSEQLTKALASQGVRPETLKARVKADYTWQQLVRGRYQQALLVGEKDIQVALNTSGEAKNTENSFEYSLRPVVLLVTTGSDTTVDTRRKEAEALRAKVQTCNEAEDIFRNLRGAVIRDVVSKTSADIPPALRTVLDSTPIGHLTPPEVTRQGVEMVALCERKPTTLDTPQKRKIRDELFAKKYEIQSKKYLDELRRSAMIEYR